MRCRVSLESWEVIKEKFTETFSNIIINLLDLLHNIRQGHMSVQDYIIIFEGLTYRCDMREHCSQTITRFVSGLRYKIKRFMITSVTPRSGGYGDVTATYIRRSEIPSRIYAKLQYRQKSEAEAQWQYTFQQNNTSTWLSQKAIQYYKNITSPENTKVHNT